MQNLRRQVLTLLLSFGRRLSPLVLWLLFWPASAYKVALELLKKRRDYRVYAQLPLVIRPGGSYRLLFWPALWHQQTRLKAIRELDRWPDLYGSPSWRDRFFLVGSEQTIALVQARDRPLILYSFHTGPLALITGLLRSYKIPMAGLWGFHPRLTNERQAIEHAADEVNGLYNVPSWFHPSQIHQAATFLRRQNGVLATPGSGSTKDNVLVEADGVSACLGTSILRLAVLTKAVVVPMVAQAGPRGTFQVHLGSPVYPEQILDSTTLSKTCGDFLSFFVSTTQNSPGQILPAFAQAIVEASAQTKAT